MEFLEYFEILANLEIVPPCFQALCSRAIPNLQSPVSSFSAPSCKQPCEGPREQTVYFQRRTKLNSEFFPAEPFQIVQIVCPPYDHPVVLNLFEVVCLPTFFNLPHWTCCQPIHLGGGEKYFEYFEYFEIQGWWWGRSSEFSYYI